MKVVITEDQFNRVILKEDTGDKYLSGPYDKEWVESIINTEIDYDKVLRDMKLKFGWGDLSPQWIEEFEEEIGDVIGVMNTNEYINLFADWMESKSIGDRR